MQTCGLAELTTVDPTTADLPTADLPTADLPTADLPTADLPTADLPTADYRAERSSLMIASRASMTSSRSTLLLVNRSCRLNALVGAL